MCIILNFTVLKVKQLYKIMNVIIFCGSCIEENHRTSLRRFREAKVLYIFFLYYYKMCEITVKLPF